MDKTDNDGEAKVLRLVREFPDCLRQDNIGVVPNMFIRTVTSVLQGLVSDACLYRVATIFVATTRDVCSWAG